MTSWTNLEATETQNSEAGTPQAQKKEASEASESKRDLLENSKKSLPSQYVNNVNLALPHTDMLVQGAKVHQTIQSQRKIH